MYTGQSPFGSGYLEDSSLFYEANEKPHIWQYDGLRTEFQFVAPTDFILLRYIRMPNFPWTYASIQLGIQSGGLQCETVNQMWEHVSYEVTMKGRWWHIPWMGFITIRNGYTQPIAYYSLRTWSAKFGIEINNFSFTHVRPEKLPLP